MVMPTRDRSGLLRRAIASVQTQTHVAWELIVVDDRSSDDTPEVLREIEDSRIRSFASPGRGAPAARNKGLAEARGNVVTYLDDDNVMLPHWLATVAWAFDRFADCDITYGARIPRTKARWEAPACCRHFRCNVSIEPGLSGATTSTPTS